MTSFKKDEVTMEKTDGNKTITFRIDSGVLDKLKNHSKFEKVTLNALVNQLLAQAVDWDIKAAKAGWVPIEKSVLEETLHNLNEKTVTDIAKMAGKIIAKDMALSMVGNFGVNEWVSILKLRAKAAGFGFTEVNDGDHKKFVMRHGMGYKCSLHWKTFYEYGFKGLGCPVSLDVTENTIVYKIPTKYLDSNNSNLM